MDINKSVEYIVKTLEGKKMTLSAAESCTGGMVSSVIVDYAGASAVFMDGIVSYSNEAKMKFLGVSPQTLEKYGAVSAQTAEEMCRGVSRESKTDIGISTTGVAGPGGGTPQKPVGTVYIGICINGRVKTKLLELKGSRTEIRQQTTQILLNDLIEEIDKL
ncbi:MAG: CinA family protein [Firmicutes bacterium]|nr:CinA family protein [Bacillota bacterium]